MPAQILKPKGFDVTRRYPVILHIYGGPSAPTVADAWQKETLFDNLLASKGYIAVAIDNRAATAISKTLENTFGEPGRRRNSGPGCRHPLAQDADVGGR